MKKKNKKNVVDSWHTRVRVFLQIGERMMMMQQLYVLSFFVLFPVKNDAPPPKKYRNDSPTVCII